MVSAKKETQEQSAHSPHLPEPQIPADLSLHSPVTTSLPLCTNLISPTLSLHSPQRMVVDSSREVLDPASSNSDRHRLISVETLDTDPPVAEDMSSSPGSKSRFAELIICVRKADRDIGLQSEKSTHHAIGMRNAMCDSGVRDIKRMVGGGL